MMCLQLTSALGVDWMVVRGGRLERSLPGFAEKVSSLV